MNKIIRPLVYGILLSTSFSAIAQDYLKACWDKQVRPLQRQYISFSFHEKLNKLEHSFEPWQQSEYIGKGIIWSSANDFLKQDTLIAGKKTYYSKTFFNKSVLLFLDYGDKDLYAATTAMFSEQTFKSARYIPTSIIDYFFQQKINSNIETNNKFAVYETAINKKIIKLFIRKRDNLLEKITILNSDDLFGDVLSIIHYSDFSIIDKLHYPKKIKIDKINGKIEDEVILLNAILTNKIPKLLEKPVGYELKEPEQIKPEFETIKYNNKVHFVNLKHTDDRAMIVEFDSFLVVVEAPVNSKNGEIIISEAKKIAPNKSIKYFSFGHYHPHYLGGVRPFIHKGANIICSEINEDYIKYIANAPHTLNPDSLQIEPKPLLVKHIKDSLTISDGNFEMKIYFIGEKSLHTKDYLIYYFPAEKLLFEGDLVWIAKEGAIKKASGRQAGLYNAIKALNLEIEVIVQSWPVADYGVKTVIPFKDLEKSIHTK